VLKTGIPYNPEGGASHSNPCPPKSAIDLFAIENHIKTAKINAFGRLEPFY
jgi:hypothetical protein